MSLLSDFNEYMGVEPPSIKKRLVIGSTATLVVTIFDLLVLLAWAGILGVINIFGLAFVPVANIDRVAQIILILSGFFVVSMVYYIILPTKKEEMKQPIEGQYIWTLRE